MKRKTDCGPKHGVARTGSREENGDAHRGKNNQNVRQRRVARTTAQGANDRSGKRRQRRGQGGERCSLDKDKMSVATFFSSVLS